MITFDDLDSIIRETAYEISAARNRFIEGKLRAAITHLEGAMPSNEVIAARARRIIFPDGRVEWMWDNTMILRQHPPAFEPGDKFCIRFDAPEWLP